MAPPAPRAALPPPLLAILLLSAAVPVARGMYPAGGPVVNLDPSSFKQRITGDGLWLVEFYAPWCGHCKALQPEWVKAAEALKGIANVAAVDADAHKSLGGEYGVRGFPTIKLLTVQGGRVVSSDYTGGRTAKDIARFALDAAQKLVASRLGGGGGGSGGGSAGGSGGSHGQGGSASEFYGGTAVVDLTSGNFDELVGGSNELWMVEFYAPWCGHCRQLKPSWVAAAEQLAGKVHLGAVNCDESNDVCGRFGVRGFPTIKYFGEDKERPSDYDGGRDAGDIVSFALGHWEKSAPTAEVRELVDNEVFVNECVGHEGDEALDLEGTAPRTLCVLAFLPHILDSKAGGRNAYLGVLRAGAEAFKGRPFSFLWAEGGRQAALEANLEVGGFGYPAVVALSPSKMRFSTMRSALEEAHLRDWIESIRKGGERTVPIQGNLAELAHAEPWDGRDGASYEEDEFDLSELDEE